jgi:hypothetical protein
MTYKDKTDTFKEKEAIPEAYFRINPSVPYHGPQFSEEDKSLWKLEVEDLELERKEFPLDTRIIYDLAKRYHWLGNKKESEHMFRLLQDIQQEFK